MSGAEVGQELPGKPGPQRPKDAATLLILDKTISGWRVLMGRRSMGHVFLPGKMVFPGGRCDATDRFVPTLGELHPSVHDKLSRFLPPRAPSSRPRILAVTALRETAEETGILVGGALAAPSRHLPEAFRLAQEAPNLSPLVLVARAVTPPKRVRRFDARFFAVGAKHISKIPEKPPGDELEDLVWPLLSETSSLDLPNVTRRVLEVLVQRLERDNGLLPEADAVFFRDGGSGGRVEVI